MRWIAIVFALIGSASAQVTTRPSAIRPDGSSDVSISVPGVTSTSSVRAKGLLSTSISTPVNEAFSATTGTLNNGTYYYRVAAVNAVGSTLPSTETSITVSGGSSANGVVVKWGKVQGAESYDIYGRTTGAEQYLASSTSTYWTDNGSLTPSGSLPIVNTTGGVIIPEGSRYCLDAACSVSMYASSGALYTGGILTDIQVGYVFLDDAHENYIYFNGDDNWAQFEMPIAYFSGTVEAFAALKSENIRWTATTLGTCGSTIVYTARTIAGSAGNYGKICFCTYNGTTYAWKNISGIFASDAASIGNTTTCPNP